MILMCLCLHSTVQRQRMKDRKAGFCLAKREHKGISQCQHIYYICFIYVRPIKSKNLSVVTDIKQDSKISFCCGGMKNSTLYCGRMEFAKIFFFYLSA